MMNKKDNAGETAGAKRKKIDIRNENPNEYYADFHDELTPLDYLVFLLYSGKVQEIELPVRRITSYTYLLQDEGINFNYSFLNVSDANKITPMYLNTWNSVVCRIVQPSDLRAVNEDFYKGILLSLELTVDIGLGKFADYLNIEKHSPPNLLIQDKGEQYILKKMAGFGSKGYLIDKFLKEYDNLDDEKFYNTVFRSILAKLINNQMTKRIDSCILSSLESTN